MKKRERGAKLMTTVDFITELFCQVDDEIGWYPKHSQANLYPSEVVTLALLYSLTGKRQREFWRWLTRDYRVLFPNLPCRTRLFRLFNTHTHFINNFTHFYSKTSLPSGARGFSGFVPFSDFT